MDKRYKYLLKNIGILSVSNFSSKILIFLLVPVYTSILSTREYGIYDLIISTVQLLFPLFTLNIIDSVMRFCMDKQNSKREVANIGLVYIFRSFFYMFIFLIICRRFYWGKSFDGLEIYIFFYFISYGFNQFFAQFAKGMEQVRDMGIAGVLGTFVLIGNSILFLLVFKRGIVGFLLANILAQAVSAGYYAIQLKIWKYIRKETKCKKLKKEMLEYCMPLMMTAIGWWVNSASDKYVVSIICGISANGILSVAYKIPSIINTFQTIFIQAWQISAIKEYGTRQSRLFYGNVFLDTNLLMSIVCAILIIFTKPIANILYAKDFYSAWMYVPFLLISSVLNSASGFIGALLGAIKDSNSMAKAAVYGTSANIILNFILVCIMGVQGATIATVISSLIIYIIRKKAISDTLIVDNYIKVILTWILLFIQAMLEVYFEAWIMEVVIIITIIFVNRRNLFRLLKINTFEKSK